MTHQGADGQIPARERRRAVKRLSGKQARLTLYYMLTQFIVMLVVAFAMQVGTDQAQSMTYLPSALIGLLIATMMRGFGQINRDLAWRDRRMTGGAFLKYAVLMTGVQGLLQVTLVVMELILNRMGLSVLDSVARLNESMDSTDSIQMFAYVALVGPVVEELIFRGAVLHTLRARGDWFAILISSVLFALMHGYLPQALFALPVGLLLGYVALNYSVPWSIALHIFNNLVLSQGLSWLQRNLGDAGSVLTILVIYGSLLASLAIVGQKWHAIGKYKRSHASGPHEVRWALSSVWVWVLIAFMLRLTVSLVAAVAML